MFFKVSKLALLTVLAIASIAGDYALGTIPTAAAHGPSQLADGNDIVAFNVQNSKYHDLNCLWAKRCTVNCIKIKRSEAHARGGIPCMVCNGGED